MELDLDLGFDTDGWLVGVPDVHKFFMRPRPDKDGVRFCPVNPNGLGKYVKNRYDGPRIVVVHGTDVVAPVVRMGRRKAKTSPRKASYNFLLGQGKVVQLASIYDKTWHAGRKLKKYIEAFKAGGNQAALARQVCDGKRFTWPVVDGKVVGDPNAWGPGIELMSWQRLEYDEHPRIATTRHGKRVDDYRLVTMARPQDVVIEAWHNFDPRDLENLEALLRVLYAETDITPDATFRHSDLHPLGRIDPGPLCHLESIAQAAAKDPEAMKDADDDNEGDEDEYFEPWVGPAPHD